MQPEEARAENSTSEDNQTNDPEYMQWVALAPCTVHLYREGAGPSPFAPHIPLYLGSCQVDAASERIICGERAQMLRPNLRTITIFLIFCSLSVLSVFAQSAAPHSHESPWSSLHPIVATLTLIYIKSSVELCCPHYWPETFLLTTIDIQIDREFSNCIYQAHNSTIPDASWFGIGDIERFRIKISTPIASGSYSSSFIRGSSLMRLNASNILLHIVPDKLQLPKAIVKLTIESFQNIC